MEVSEVTEYDHLAEIHQTLEIARLNEVLKRHGITDGEVRKSICRAYFTACGQFFDNGWFRYRAWFGDRKLYPQLCFAEKKPPSEWQAGYLGEIATRYVPRDGFDFAYAGGTNSTGGNLYWYFEDRDEDLEEIEQGLDFDYRGGSKEER